MNDIHAVNDNETTEERPRYEPTEADLRNSAFYYVNRWYHDIFKGKVYGKSMLDLIRECETPDELKLLVEGEWPGASNGTRRKWAKAAEAKYREFAA